MSDIETGDNVHQGIRIIISVSELDDEYWSSVDLHIPEDEDIDTTEFLVLLKGIEIAHDKIVEVLQQIDDTDFNEDEDDSE